MKPTFQTLFFAAGHLVCVSLCGAPLTPADLEAQISPLIENGVLQAVSCGVIQPEGSVTANAGALSPENPVPPNDRTIYEIGSINKVFTSLLLADAVVRGDLSLDTTISELLPPGVVLPDGAGERITLRMLSTHTSGLPRIPIEIPPDNYTNPYANYDEEDLWETLRHVTLDFEPGTKASYSNLGGGLLGTLLARHYQTTYAALLADRITGPLGLEDTIINLNDEQRARFAPAFTSKGEPWTHWDFKALAGAGGIRSTSADMKRFAAAILHPDGTPLKEAIDLSLQKQELTATIVPGGQALGWMLAGNGITRWHNGQTGGFHAALMVDRERGTASWLLTNRSAPIGTKIAENLIRRASSFAESPVPNADRTEVALSTEQLDQCIGTFRINGNFALVVERRGEALFVTPTNQPPDRLYAASANTFFSRRVAAEIVFEFPDAGGNATALTLKQNGREAWAPRE